MPSLLGTGGSSLAREAMSIGQYQEVGGEIGFIHSFARGQVVIRRQSGEEWFVEQRHGVQVVSAHVPLAEMFGYSTSLRSATEGRAVYSMQFHHYAPVPNHIGDQLAAKSRGY